MTTRDEMLVASHAFGPVQIRIASAVGGVLVSGSETNWLTTLLFPFVGGTIDLRRGNSGGDFLRSGQWAGITDAGEVCVSDLVS